MRTRSSPWRRDVHITCSDLNSNMSAADDEVDALATRIEEIDELGAGDDATYGNDQWGLGAVLKMLIKNADVEGVRRHLELIDYHDEAVSAHHLGLAARLLWAVRGPRGVSRASIDELISEEEVVAFEEGALPAAARAHLRGVK